MPAVVKNTYYHYYQLLTIIITEIHTEISYWHKICINNLA